MALWNKKRRLLTKNPLMYERRISDYFASNPLSLRIEREQFQNPACFIIFNNRSGSFLFMDMLAKSKQIKTTGEVFNFEKIKNKCRSHGIANLNDYIKFLVGDCNSETVFCAKIGVNQLEFLYKTGLFDSFSARPKFFYMRRRALIDQAISFYIANNTKQWTSFQKTEKSFPEYSFNKIEKVLLALNNSIANFYYYSTILKISVKEVFYEDLFSDTTKTMNSAFSYLGVNGEKVNINDSKYKKQDSAIKREYIEKFRHDSIMKYGLIKY